MKRIIFALVILLLFAFAFGPKVAFVSAQSEAGNSTQGVIQESVLKTASATDSVALLAFQLGIILFAVRGFGGLADKMGIPSVLGELIAGIIIGPFALGGIALPGFPEGVFPIANGQLAVSNELYAIASIASIFLLFVSGLQTDIGLFLRYSVAGGVIGLGGVVFSFLFGDLLGVFLLGLPFMSPQCLFLGILCTATSVGITARILSENKKMDSPEGVTILAAAVFDDVLGIIALAIVLGITTVMTAGGAGPAINGIVKIAVKEFGIWLGFTALGLIFSRKIAGFLKGFRHTYDFSILALGIALLLSGILEKQGLAMIIGAYIAGLSLSKTDIAPVIEEHIHGIYEFFIPIFFVVMGMMVNVREIMAPSVLFFGVIYTIVAILAKIIGCGGPALLLGFNAYGSLRIGVGMIPRGEVALIVAGIGLASGILDHRLFAVVILMTLVTTLVAAPLLSSALKLKKPGTRKIVRGDDSFSASWDFTSKEIANLVAHTFLMNLKAEGFYVQRMNIDEGISQARKDDTVVSITEDANILTISTARIDLLFVKTAISKVVLDLYESIQELKNSFEPVTLKKDLLSIEGRLSTNLLSLITADCVTTNLRGETKEEILTEMVNILFNRGRLNYRDLVLKDVFEREKIMSSGMQHGIAIPHVKTDGVNEIAIAIGIKKEGMNFESIDEEKSKIFILIISPKKTSSPYIQLMVAISTVLQDENIREKMINAASPEEVVRLFNGSRFST